MVYVVVSWNGVTPSHHPLFMGLSIIKQKKMGDPPFAEAPILSYEIRGDICMVSKGLFNGDIMRCLVVHSYISMGIYKKIYYDIYIYFFCLLWLYIDLKGILWWYHEITCIYIYIVIYIYIWLCVCNYIYMIVCLLLYIHIYIHIWQPPKKKKKKTMPIDLMAFKKVNISIF